MTITSPAAPTGTYRLDPVHTRLGFVARHIMGTKVRGVFETFQGRVHLDIADLERSSAEAMVEAASVNTGNARRDKHLRAGDFFDAANHPQITFRSTTVHRLEDDRFRLAGNLTVKGRTRPVTFELSHIDAGEDSYGRRRVAFEGRAAVSRKDWGLTWGGVLVADTVTLELELATAWTGDHR